MTVDKAIFALAALATCVSGQTNSLDAPVSKWTTTFEPMGDGNGVTMAPDNTVLYATTENGSVGAFNPEDGTELWRYAPTGAGPFSGNGEVSIAADNSYLVYGVTEGLNLGDEKCQVFALSPSGDVLWSSPSLEGVCQGTPHISSDGAYVFVTHNSNFTNTGHFTILENDNQGDTLWSTTDTNGAFSPPGFFRNPNEGFYGAGKGNTQDLLVWSYAPRPDATSGEPGSTFAFQLPNYNYDPDVMGTDMLTLTKLIITTGWRSSVPPLLTAGGLQLHWPVSRSQFRSWVNMRFSASATGSASFTRGSPGFAAPLTTPAVDNDETPTIVCSGTAAWEFVCMNAADVSAGAIWKMDLAGVVKSNPVFAPAGDVVYFVEERGKLTAAKAETGDVDFAANANNNAPVVSNFCLSEDGSHLYYGDEVGNVVAWEVAQGPAPPPTAAPTAPPTAMEATEAPTTMDDTNSPTGSPVAQPVVSPTVQRVDTPAPTARPTAAPVAPSSAATLSVSLLVIAMSLVATMLM